jgi:hypothetical protein
MNKYINQLKQVDHTIWIILFIVILILVVYFIPGKYESFEAKGSNLTKPSPTRPSVTTIPTKLTSASFTPSTAGKYKSVSNYNQDLLSTHGAFNMPHGDNRNLSMPSQTLPSINKSWGYKGPGGSTVQPTKPHQDYASMITYTSSVNKGTCSYSIYGCCPDNTTAKVDASGSNCQMCSDGVTYFTDSTGTNCPVSYGL